MYFIRKYADCWAIYDDDSNVCRPLSLPEIKELTIEFPELADEDVRTVFADTILSIDINLPPSQKGSWKEQNLF